MKEPELKTKMVKYLNSLPESHAFRVEPRPGLGRGTADIILCRQGRFYAIEVKMPGNVATPLQELFLRRIKSSGGTSMVVYSLEELKLRI
jgi:hypothetical protein